MKHQYWADYSLNHSSTRTCCLLWGQTSCNTGGAGQKASLCRQLAPKREREEGAVHSFLPNLPIKYTAPPPLWESAWGDMERPGLGDVLWQLRVQVLSHGWNIRGGGSALCYQPLLVAEAGMGRPGKWATAGQKNNGGRWLPDCTWHWLLLYLTSVLSLTLYLLFVNLFHRHGRNHTRPEMNRTHCSLWSSQPRRRQTWSGPSYFSVSSPRILSLSQGFSFV